MSKSREKKRPFTARQELVARAMMAGRESGARSIIFHQAAAEILGLNATDTRCLDLILRNGPSNPTDLAELTGLTTGAVTTLIDRLEKAGLIERKPHAHDRRKKLLVPTTKVWEKVGPLYGSMAHSMTLLMARYTDKELEFLESFLNELTGLWKKETEKLLHPGKNGTRQE